MKETDAINDAVHDATTLTTNPKHGSRRGLGSMVGACFGWVLGSLAFIFYRDPTWLLVLPLVGALIGFVSGKYLVARE